MTAPARCPSRLLVWLPISLICLAIAGCGDYTTTTTTESVVAASTTLASPATQMPGRTMPAPAITGVAVTHQSPVVAYGAVFSAFVALVIAVSGTFALLRRPRLKLAHKPDKVEEDVVPGGKEGEWYWRVRVLVAKRSWGLFVPRTAQGVEIFVTRLRRTHNAKGKKVAQGKPLDTPVVSCRRIPWTIPTNDRRADPDGIAPVSIPAGTFRYITAIGPRYAVDEARTIGARLCRGQRGPHTRTRKAFYALHLKPGTTADRYDIGQWPGTWVAELVVSADDVRARRWSMTIVVAASSLDGDRTKDAVTLTLTELGGVIRRTAKALRAMRRASVTFVTHAWPSPHSDSRSSTPETTDSATSCSAA